MTEQTKALSVFGSRTDIAEIKSRLMQMTLPGGKKLSENECRALAQLAIAHGLDPFNGEIWMIPGTGPMIGIKGLRKKAREQISNGHAGNFWCNFRAIQEKSERDTLLIPAGALAFECHLFDTETVNTYVSTIKQLKDAGMPWDSIVAVVGSQPYTSGYGYYKSGESSKMSPVQAAMKRSEADAIKRRFDVPWDLAVEGPEGVPDMDTIPVEWREAVEPAKTTPEQRAADNTAIFGEREYYPNSDKLIDVGPGFDVETPEASKQETPAPEPAKATATQNGNGKVKPASIKTQLWYALRDTLAQQFPKYQKADGTADPFHILTRIAKLGFDSITDDNIQDVQAKFEEYAKQPA
jgi:hypothetical protein